METMNKDTGYGVGYFEDDTEFMQELEDNKILNEYREFVEQYESEGRIQ